METYNGALVRVLQRGFQRSREADISVRHIPGSDNSFIDRAGKKVPRLQVTIMFTNFTAYRAFESQVNAPGTLILETEGVLQVVLENCGLTNHYPGGEVEATASFIITAG